jgi:hypothetical protein
LALFIFLRPFTGRGVCLPLTYKSGHLNSEIAQLLKKCQIGELPPAIPTFRCIPPPDYFEVRLPETFGDILKTVVIVDPKYKGKADEGTWGCEINRAGCCMEKS